MGHDHDHHSHEHGHNHDDHDGDHEHGHDDCGHEDCDHDHCDHDHDHNHDHAHCDHDHDHGHAHHHHGEEVKEKFSLRALFRHAAGFVKNNKLQAGALFSSVLLGTTALATPLISSTIGAGALLLGSVFMLNKTADITLNNTLAFGEKKHISPLTLGLVIGFLNTIPETMVSLGSVFHGATELGLGNIVGSNIAHSLLILGATAAATGIAKAKDLSWKFNTAIMAGATAAFGAQLLTGKLSVAFGAAMLGMGGYYLKRRLFNDKAKGEECSTGTCLFHDHGDGDHGHSHGEITEGERKRPGWFNGIMGLAGMGGLMAASDLLVRSGSNFALNMGMSEAVLGASVIALLTAAPELALNIKAARRKNSELAVGNILGCNIFNTLIAGGIMSLTGAAVPAAFQPGSPLGNLNFWTFAGSGALLTAALLKNKGGMKRWQGGAALALYAAYLAGSAALSGGDIPFHKHDLDLQPPAITAPAEITTPFQSVEAPFLPPLETETSILLPPQPRQLPAPAPHLNS